MITTTHVCARVGEQILYYSWEMTTPLDTHLQFIRSLQRACFKLGFLGSQLVSDDSGRFEIVLPWKKGFIFFTKVLRYTLLSWQEMSTAFMCLLYSHPQLITASVVNKYEQSAKKDNKETPKSCRVKEEEIAIPHIHTDSWRRWLIKTQKGTYNLFFRPLHNEAAKGQREMF